MIAQRGQFGEGRIRIKARRALFARLVFEVRLAAALIATVLTLSAIAALLVRPALEWWLAAWPALLLAALGRRACGASPGFAFETAFKALAAVRGGRPLGAGLSGAGFAAGGRRGGAGRVAGADDPGALAATA